METIESFKATIMPLRHGRVVNIGLYIWPIIEDGRFTDTQLHIKTLCIDGVLRENTFSTAPDGQSPRVEAESLTGGMPFSQLIVRLNDTNRHDNHNMPPSAYEFYEASNYDELGAAIQSTISDILYVRNADIPDEIVCVAIVFDNGFRVWSGASAYGNIVAFSENDFVWPFRIEYLSFF